ncbi:MAG: SoxR reducing system RseC family protein [Woeseia sp.]
MDTPTAEILSIDGHSAVLRVAGVPACARCAAGKGCGAGLLGADAAPRELRLSLPPGIHFRRGDTVRLALRPARLLQASLYAYGLPLLALTLVPLLVNWAVGPLGDATLAVVALAAITVAVLAGRRLLARERCLDHLTPIIAGHAGVGEA